MISFFSKFPLVILHIAANFMAFIANSVLAYRKDVIEENLKGAFPEATENEIRKYRKGFYKSFFQVLAEMLKSFSFTEKDWEKRVKVTNPELVKGFLNKGKSVVMLSGHEANWEWTAFAFQQLIDQQLYFLYKPIKDPNFNQHMLELRSKHGGIAIDKDKALRQLVKLRNQVIAIGIVGDQLPSIGTEKYWLDFLNRKSAFYTGAEKIAKSFGNPVLYGRTTRLKRGYYELSFELIHDGEEPLEEGQVTKRFAEALERNIRKHPTDYLWSHRRWKYSMEQAEEASGRKQLFVS